MSQEVPVAVIMRSKDEYPHVERALESLYRQTYKNFVLYNVDSGSTDGTWESILRYNKYPDRIVRIRPEDYVPGRVLNLMIAMSREPIVVFLNSDAVPVNDRWLENLVRPLLAGEADATMSRQVPRRDAYFIVAYDYLRAFNKNNIVGKNDDFFSAVACGFHRELWNENKFYVDGFSEDMAWAKACREQGYRFRLVEGSLVEHSHNYTLSQLQRRKFIEGEADVYIYGKGANALQQVYLWGREVLRDTLFTLRKGRFWHIPYNLVYRTVCHIGWLQGRRSGVAKFGVQKPAAVVSAPVASQEPLKATVD